VRPIAAFGLPLFVLILVAIELLAPAGSLEYRRALLAAEPWRLITGHFVHLSLTHALLNCVALMLLGRLFDARLKTGELWAVLGGAPVLISLGFWLFLPELEWYRGLSGALHTLYFAGCIVWLGEATGRGRWLPMAALALGALKVLMEQPWDASFPFREWLGGAVVPQAHLIGATIGIAAGLGMRAVRARRRSV